MCATLASKPLKPHKTLAELAGLLEARGLFIGDPARAEATLCRLGYYRLAGYFYPLRRTRPRGDPGRLDEFVEGASLDLVVQLYEFDKQLRLLALDAAERIEVAIRTAIAHDLGRLAPDAHRRTDVMDRSFTAKKRHGQPSAFEQWQERFNRAVRDSHDEFVAHHRAEYAGEMPIWVAIELWDFGLLSRFFEGMQYKARTRIAHAMGRLSAEELQSWLRTLNFVRNVSAHHSRLWNRNVPEIPRLPKPDMHPLLAHLHRDALMPRRLYGAMACARYLLRAIDPMNDWHVSLRLHLDRFPAWGPLTLGSAGFPERWTEEALWR